LHLFCQKLSSAGSGVAKTRTEEKNREGNEEVVRILPTLTRQGQGTFALLWLLPFRVLQFCNYNIKNVVTVTLQPLLFADNHAFSR
jgi:hypothetical protein